MEWVMEGVGEGVKKVWGSGERGLGGFKGENRVWRCLNFC